MIRIQEGLSWKGGQKYRQMSVKAGLTILIVDKVNKMKQETLFETFN